MFRSQIALDHVFENLSLSDVYSLAILDRLDI